MARVGRPTNRDSEVALTHHVGTRFTQGERLALDERAAGAGMTVSAYMRSTALGQVVRRRQAPSPVGILSPDEINALNRIGVNLNQLARHMNAGQDGDVADQIVHALTELNAVWRRYLP